MSLRPEDEFNPGIQLWELICAVMILSSHGVMLRATVTKACGLKGFSSLRTLISCLSSFKSMSFHFNEFIAHDTMVFLWIWIYLLISVAARESKMGKTESFKGATMQFYTFCRGQFLLSLSDFTTVCLLTADTLCNATIPLLNFFSRYIFLMITLWSRHRDNRGIIDFYMRH